MAWESRREKRFYYEAYRVGNCVKKVYLGRGKTALEAAQKAADLRQLRVRERAEIRAIEATVASAEALMVELEEGVRTLSNASLLAANYHQHRGNWRKYRG